jgi:hypothetical protein
MIACSGRSALLHLTFGGATILVVAHCLTCRTLPEEAVPDCRS